MWDWITLAWEASCEEGFQRYEQERRLTSEELEVALDVVLDGEGPLGWALGVLESAGVCPRVLRGPDPFNWTKLSESRSVLAYPRSSSNRLVASASSSGRRRYIRVGSGVAYHRAAWSGTVGGRR